MTLRWLSMLTLPLVTGAALTACGDNEHAANLAPDEQSLTEKELLGKRLFEDTRLSEPQGQSCASCHDPAHAFTGNAGSTIAGVSAGAAPGVFGTRNTPTAMYAMFNPPFSFAVDQDDEGKTEYVPTGGQFWDGRADTLADQAKGPLLNPREMNNPDKSAVVAKVRAGAYADLFVTVFPNDGFRDVDATYDHIAEAIEAFESSTRFRPFASKFDAFLRGEQPLDPVAARGFALFKDPEKGNCISCHVGDVESQDPEDWLFTDFTYDNLGVPRNTEIPDNADPTHFDLGLCEQEGIAERAPADVDMHSLCGAFKVPTLRNIAVTGPYMHNGKFTNLRDVVRFYVTRDTNPDVWYPAGNKFDDLPADARDNVNQEEVPYDRHPGEAPRLTDAEIDAVVAFLETLTDRAEEVATRR